MKQQLTFQQGVKDGFPIGLGYFFVALTFGLTLTKGGFPFWLPILTSATNLSGTGQLAAAEMLLAGSTLLEIAFTVFMVNLRYFLMSVAVSQKLSPSIKGWQRLIIAMSVTDENFAIEVSKPEINFLFVVGLLLSSWTGWVAGTAVGSLIADFIPASLQSAMGILLYAMFIAIVVPAAKHSKAVAFVAALSIALSCLFKWTPVLKLLSSGWVIIICGVVSALLGAIIFPVKEEPEAKDVADFPNLEGREQ